MAKLKIALLFLVVLLALVSLLLWNQHTVPTMTFTIATDDMESMIIVKTNESTYPNNSSNTPDLIATVKKFVFFIGYARSGHSIIGSLMDAHPHIVIANEFYLFRKFTRLDEISNKSWKKNLFDLLFKKSIRDAASARLESNKGYTLAVSDQWQGKYDRYVEVIGDKSGGMTTTNYRQDKAAFIDHYEQLSKSLSIPIRIIHAVRNPFDIISTAYIYKKMGKIEQKSNLKSKELDLGLMRSVIKDHFKQFAAVHELIEEVFGPENVLEIHNCDLVGDPKATISQIFQFLGVEASEEFLDICAAKIFKSVSRSRDLIEWSPELREQVEKEIKKYTFFDLYSFTSLS